MPLPAPSRSRRARRRIGPLLVAAALVALLSPIFPAGAGAATTSASSDYVARINALRGSLGRAPLQVDGELTAIAQDWSAHMAATGTLAHSPNLAAGITSPWLKLGENVGTGPSNDAIWTAFVNSAHHYANIVDPAFNRVGVGVAISATGAQWTTQRFMQVSGGGGGGGGTSAPAPSSPAPTSKAPKAKASPPPAPAPTTVTTAPPAPALPPPPQPGPPPPADSARVAAVLTALRHLST